MASGADGSAGNAPEAWSASATGAVRCYRARKGDAHDEVLKAFRTLAGQEQHQLLAAARGGAGDPPATSTAAAGGGAGGARGNCLCFKVRLRHHKQTKANVEDWLYISATDSTPLAEVPVHHGLQCCCCLLRPLDLRTRACVVIVRATRTHTHAHRCHAMPRATLPILYITSNRR